MANKLQVRVINFFKRFFMPKSMTCKACKSFADSDDRDEGKVTMRVL